MTQQQNILLPFDLGPVWQDTLSEELRKDYVRELADFVQKERATGKNVYPPEGEVFNALLKTPYHRVKVVIVGQDPYHGPGQAHGLCFSVNKGVPLPPSLKNIFKELCEDVNCQKPIHGCLNHWAQQGVLLLNVTLTVVDGNPLSHHGRGWECFTDAIIKKLSEREDPIIFVLWGKNAQDKCEHIEASGRHYVLKAAHPSPFSAYRGFFGCRHFSKVNEILRSLGKTPIDWSLLN